MQLKEIRTGLGISQSKVARDLNITQATYNRYENGQRQIPNSILLSMADYFGVSSDEILGRPGQTDKKSQENGSPRTLEAQIVSSAMDKLPQEQREQILNVVRAMCAKHPEIFNTEKGDDDDS